MRERPTFLPADPPEQLPQQRLWEARASVEQQAAVVADQLDQVERLCGPLDKVRDLRSRLSTFIPMWVSLTERGDLLIAELSQLTGLHDQAIAQFETLHADIVGLFRSMTAPGGGVSDHPLPELSEEDEDQKHG